MGDALETIVDLATSLDRPQCITAEDFDRIVRLHQRRIYRVLLSLVNDPDLADNLTQECFLRAYQKRDTFRGEASIETWLIRIAVNLARDQARNRRWAFWRTLFPSTEATNREMEACEASDPGPSPERVVLAREQLAAVHSIVQKLSPQQGVVFALRFFEELSLEEIAHAMKLEVGTVKAHLFRAVHAVRKGMKGQK